MAAELSTQPVSIVVCTHNGAAMLPVALRALAAQRVDGPRPEIVVVDDRSDDGSGEIAAAAGATVVRPSGAGGLAAARNAGVAAATGEIIAFTDDDCEPEPDWLSQLVAPLADPAVDGTAGATVPASRESLMFRYLQLRNPLAPLPAELLHSRHPLFRLGSYLRSGVGPTPALGAGAPLYSVAGANMALRRTLLDSLTGFDPAIRFGGEEEDLCRRAHERAAGACFRYAPAAVVRHHYRPGLADTLRRSRAYGRGNARQIAATAGAWPIVYPFPLLAGTVTAVALGRRRRRGWLGRLAALALPAALYPGWVSAAVRRRDPELLLFGYLQLAQETATMLGEAEYTLGGRHL